VTKISSGTSSLFKRIAVLMMRSKEWNGRIIVACVASNLQRVQQILNAAEKAGRKVVLTGQDLDSRSEATWIGFSAFDEELNNAKTPSEPISAKRR
jgi:hypothetical protein